MTDSLQLMTNLTGYAIDVFPDILFYDFARYAIGATGVFLLINGLMAGLLAGRRIRDTRPGWKQIGTEVARSLRTVVVFATVGGLTIALLEHTGLLTISSSPSTAAEWLYYALNVAILLVLHDAWFYWSHRIIHHPKLFRRFHRAHHTSHNPTPFTSYSFDVEEAAINAIFFPLALLIVPTSALAAFTFTATMMILNAIGHCGYEVYPRRNDGRPLFDWKTTTTHHDLHHAQAGYNYGLYFTFWDRVMGTEHSDYHEKFAQAVRRPLLPKSKSHPAVIFGSFLSVVAVGIGTEDASALGATDIHGVWATEGHGLHVELGHCESDENTTCGDIVWSWDPTEITPSDATGNFIEGLSFDGDAWVGGQLHNPQDGRSYKGKASLVDPDTLLLKGCVLFICREQTWRRPHTIPGCLAASASSLKPSF